MLMIVFLAVLLVHDVWSGLMMDNWIINNGATGMVSGI